MTPFRYYSALRSPTPLSGSWQFAIWFVGKGQQEWLHVECLVVFIVFFALDKLK